MIWLYAVNSDEVSEEVVNELKDSSNDGAGCWERVCERVLGRELATTGAR